jgi:hypothetical protein
MQEKRMTMEHRLRAEGMMRILCEVVQLTKTVNVVCDVVVVDYDYKTVV